MTDYVLDPSFHWKDGELYCEDVPLKKLAEDYGTPLYVYSKDAILRAFHAYQEALKDIPHLLCYAVKANSSLAIINLLSREGAGFDIVSGGELQRVIAAGADPRKVIYSGVGKSRKEIKAAIEAEVYCFNVESEPGLDRIIAIARELQKVVPISFRVNPNVDAKTHPYISTGLRDNKFGIAYDDALRLYQKAAAASDCIKITGIDFHIGSQITEVEPFEHAAEKLIDLVDELKKVGIKLSHIDFGGGLGITYDKETPPHASALVTKLHDILVKRGYGDLVMVLEPGRSIIGNAGTLLMSVEYLKTGQTKNFCIVDTGLNDMIRPSLYQAWMDIVPIRKKDIPPVIYDVVGPICESGDWLGKNRSLAVQGGDVLALMSAGAYGMSMSSSYNSRPRAAEVMVDGDRVHLIRRREKIEDLYIGEAILP